LAAFAVDNGHSAVCSGGGLNGPVRLFRDNLSILR